MNNNLRTIDSWSVAAFNALQPGRLNIKGPVQIADRESTFGGFECNNNDAAVTFLQVWFRPVSEVTWGTTPPDMTFQFASSTPREVSFAYPIRRGTGLTVAAATTETGITASTAGMTGSILFKE